MADNRLRKLIADGEATGVCCNLRDLRLVEGDIGKAIAAFHNKTNMEAKAIGLNPRNKELAGEAGDGIELSYYSYILLWEIWISANPSLNFVTHRPAIVKVAAQPVPECNKIQTRPRTPVGRPKAILGEVEAT